MDKRGKLLRLVEYLVVRNEKIVELIVYYHDAGSLISDAHPVHVK